MFDNHSFCSLHFSLPLPLSVSVVPSHIFMRACSNIGRIVTRSTIQDHDSLNVIAVSVAQSQVRLPSFTRKLKRLAQHAVTRYDFDLLEYTLWFHCVGVL